MRTPKSLNYLAARRPSGVQAHYGGQHPGAVGINNGLWVLGAATPAECLRKIADYTLERIAAQIQAPTLIPEAEPGVGVSNNLP